MKEPWVKTMLRPMPVCSRCWSDVYPNRPAVKLLAGLDDECVVCEQATVDGIYVMMKIEWSS